MKLVVTHHNPDFDAMASAHAALKYYGCDAVVTCSSFEENVRKFLMENNVEFPQMQLTEKTIKDFDKPIDLLVITDCKMKTRLSILADLIDLSKKVVVIDHHPINPDDISPDKLILQDVGASTTILLEKIIKENLSITPLEATLYLLGVYEDTGFLSFTSTTSRDMQVAAKLLDAGADIGAVSLYIRREMSKQHVFLLNELLMNMALYTAKGIHVGISYGSTEEYMNDVSILAHRIIEIEHLDALFIVVRSGYRIVVVGRSKVDQVDASVILEPIGGGGHATAASSIVKDMTLNETFDRVFSLVKEYVKPVMYAKEFMTSPVKYVESSQTFDDAYDVFMKSNLNMMPVVDQGQTQGLIARKDILQGLKHGLSSEPVSSIMQIEFEIADPMTPFFEVEDIMLGQNQKLVPIEDEGILVGVLSRTDLLRLMREEIVRTPQFMSRRIANMGYAKTRNVRNLIKDRLPDKYVTILQVVGELAESLDMKAHVVGGFVRDLIMRNENLDIDIVVEGDGTVLARKFSDQTGSKISIHHKFKTAVVMMPDGFKLDFATARTEYYIVPAAAPVVENSSIKNDLYRRDFTINAMSVQLNSSHYGELLDFFAGQKDIKDRKIRVLHNLSFVDDPSRCFRAIRFAVRYGFDIGPHTHKLLKHAVSLELFDRVLGSRLMTELRYILSEARYLDGVHKLSEYNLLKFFNSKVRLTDEKLEMFEALDRISSWYMVQFNRDVELWKCRFGILFNELKFRDMAGLTKRLEFATGLKKELIQGFLKTKSAVVKLKRSADPKPYYIYQCFESLTDEFIVFAGVLLGENYEPLIKEYFTKIRKVKLELTGKDLITMGYRPSENFGKVMTSVFEQKVNGEIHSKSEEIEAAVVVFSELKKNDNG